MKPFTVLVMMVGIVALSASCKHAPAPGDPKSEWMYLGIPVDEEYPDSKFRLDGSVPQGKYWRVSRVRHVSREEYERDIASGRMLFRDRHAGTQFYATELRGDFVREGDTRYWVTILERKAYP